MRDFYTGTPVGEWVADSACRDAPDVDIFYPGPNQSKAPALAYCDRCPVAAPCLEDALATYNTQGIRAGTTEKERRRIRKARLT